METKRNNDAIELIHDGTTIGIYKLNEAIDFKSLIEFLLKDELSTDFSFNDFVTDTSSSEKEMITLIKEIIGKYNAKKFEFDKFVSSKQITKTLTKE